MHDPYLAHVGRQRAPLGGRVEGAGPGRGDHSLLDGCCIIIIVILVVVAVTATAVRRRACKYRDLELQ